MTTNENNDQRQWRIRMLLLHGAMIVAPLLLLLVHGHIGNAGICIFKEAFGIRCPACGITHSIMALFTGHIGEAFRIHPVGPIVFAIIVPMVIYLGATMFPWCNGMNWRKEVKAYKFIDVSVVCMLVITWIEKLITN